MKITLAQQHTHAGITYPAGSEVDLPEEVARWLIEVGAELREKEVADAARFDKAIHDLRSDIESRE